MDGTKTTQSDADSARQITLTDFLLARIAEDAALARGPVLPRPHLGRCGWRLGEELDDECACGYPARVLAECEAKRRIIVGLDYESDEWCFADAPAVAEVLPFLALPYADHPDYRQEWKP